jgi:hypothetical protein
MIFFSFGEFVIVYQENVSQYIGSLVINYSISFHLSSTSLFYK